MLYRAEFEAARTGELFLFVNDAMIPSRRKWFGVDYRYFYEAAGTGTARGNRGTACVRIERANLGTVQAHAPVAEGSVCAAAARRERGARRPGTE